MHHYGGLYLDLDIECYKAADESLRGYQMILQGAGDEGINNAAMASVPGLYRFPHVSCRILCKSHAGNPPLEG